MHKGMEVFGYQPRGKVFVKPNVVFASKNGEFGTHAYTHNAVIESSLSTLATSPGVDRVDMGENTGIGVPTRLSFKHAGYYETVKKVKAATGKKVGIFCIDEEKRDNLFIGGLVHDRLRVLRKMARSDSKVYLPKLKCHNITNMTGEPCRVCRRLHSLRGWSHGTYKQVFPRGPRAGGSDGLRARGRVRLRVGSDLLNRGEDRMFV
jgi:uncharacterized protein (DUF362 family)